MGGDGEDDPNRCYGHAHPAAHFLSLRPLAGKRTRWSTAVAVILGFVGIVLIYGPILWLALMSLSEQPLTGKPGPFTTIWYVKLFTDMRWLDPLMVSLAI